MSKSRLATAAVGVAIIFNGWAVPAQAGLRCYGLAGLNGKSMSQSWGRASEQRSAATSTWPLGTAGSSLEHGGRAGASGQGGEATQSSATAF